MAQVKLNATSLSSIRRQIEKMESESGAAQKKVQSAINGLDFEVSSKHNIRSSLNKIKNSLDKQAQGAINYRTAFTNVTNSIIDTDNKFESESKGILDKIKDFVEDAVGAVKTFFVKNKLAKIAAVSGLFLMNPVMISWAITIKFLSEFVKWVNNIGTVTGSANNNSNHENNNNNNSNSNDNTTVTPPEDPPVSSYDSYRNKVDSINNNPNVHYEGQLYKVEKQGDGSYKNVTGICNVCSTDILLNRKLAADGKSDQVFTVEDVLEGNGCTNISKYDGQHTRYYSNGTTKVRTGNAYEYSGGTGCAGTYTNDQGTSYTITSESPSTFNQNMTNGGYETPDQYVASLLDDHPEGIIIRNSSANHVVVITDYEVIDGKIQLYVSDPSDVRYEGQNRVPLEDSYMYGQNKNIYSNMSYIAYIS